MDCVTLTSAIMAFFFISNLFCLESLSIVWNASVATLLWRNVCWHRWLHITPIGRLSANRVVMLVNSEVVIQKAIEQYVSPDYRFV